ncbi:MAG TPA: hypothetical protein VGV37_19310 [Aliidongia sp.]|uniref:hypothetical protein n=1 Tax=Aliidongia sp. TaxID=1914230 RepID=UPI002DDD42E2|nr:hypothetical protein [Aliidongia sp.]HEV2676683.1 hypothetical protein [Aliidongia sp.]
MTGPSAFYADTDEIDQIAINLFHGWGYNFYRLENQLRTDDLLIRNKVCWLLGSARSSVEAAESAYRRTFLPPPSRAQPRPDPDAVAGAQALERLSQAIGAVEGQIRALPVPENDRMIERHRQEAATLVILLAIDRRLAGQAEMLRAAIDGKDGEWLIAHGTAAFDGLAALTETVRQRQGMLFID